MAPSTTDPLVSAQQLKTKGNAFFSKRKFSQAVSCYTEAIDGLLLLLVGSGSGGSGSVERDDDDDDDETETTIILLSGVLLSNRSSCYYEAGYYDKAADDAMACIKLLDEKLSEDSLQKSPLLCKNLWRLARALHYSSNDRTGENNVRSSRDDTQIISVLQRLKDMSDEAVFSANASKMLEQLSYYEEGGSNAMSNNKKKSRGNFEATPLLRARMKDPYVEYFHFGTDMSQSILRNAEVESQSILLKNLGNDEISLSFLFGGVGDARHVMATVLDAHHQYLGLAPARRKKIRSLHLTLNDINAQLLAKDALVLVLSYEIGRLAKDFKEAQTKREPFLMGTLIMYITMAYAMPPVVHSKFIECIKSWFTGSTRENFTKAFPWMVMSQHTWDRIVETMMAWLNPRKGYTPNLPTVCKALDNVKIITKGGGANPESHLDEMGDNEYSSNIRGRVYGAKAERRRKLEEMDIPLPTLDIIKEHFGDDVSAEEARERFIELMENMDDKNAFDPAYTLTSPMDKLFFEITHTFLPPQASPVDELRSSLPLGRLHKWVTKDEASYVIMEGELVIHKNWFVNPVQYDPEFYTFANGEVGPARCNPVMDFPQFFLTETIKSYMMYQPVDICDEEPESMNDDESVPSNDGLARNVILYYWNVGKGLNDLGGKMSVEIDLGNIVALGSQDRLKDNLPTEFHRISLSNIPDYTGMLSTLVAIGPLLAANVPSLTSSLRSNIFLNNGLWKTYDDYLYSTACLTYKQAEDIFSMRASESGEEPGIWDSFITWSRASNAKDKMSVLPIEKLRIWLHSLFLSIILPPDQDPNTPLREERPSTVSLFLTTLTVCIKDLGIPAHNIFSILDDLLGKTSLTTKAILSNVSPTLRSQECSSTKTKYNLSAFHYDLANQTAIFIQSNLLGPNVLSTKALPTSSASCYQMKLLGIEPTWSSRWRSTVGERHGSASLGFLLQKQKRSYDISTGANDGMGDADPMARMMAMMGGPGAMPPGMSKKKSKLRKDLLDCGSAIGHIFSCMEWNIKTGTVTFWLCDDLFEQFKDYTFSLIRTDGWFKIPHRVVRLGDAKRSNVH